MPRNLRSLALFGKHAQTRAQIIPVQAQYAQEKYKALLPLVGVGVPNDTTAPQTLEGDPETLLRRLGKPLPYVLRDSPRLSVTRLMTSGWCELRYLYDAVSGVKRPPSPALLRGTQAHARLEDGVHPRDAQLAAEFRSRGLGPFVGSVAYTWAATLGRLLQLAAGGECREVLCHGWVEEGPGLVSGVVARLSWGRSGAASPHPGSIEALLPQLQQLVRERTTHGNSIVVSDTKTRSTYTTPTQGSVLRATTMQLAYYRHYLEQLAQDPGRTYTSLLENGRLHGVDVDEPLAPEEIAALVQLLPSLGQDAGVLAHHGTVHIPEVGCPVLSRASPRWLAARLAQAYGLLRGALGTELRVEYYCRGTNFHTETVQWSAELLARQRAEHERDTAAFLWGERPVRPVARRLRALRTYCAHCDYNAVCGWKRGVEQELAHFGPELVALSEELGEELGEELVPGSQGQG